MTAHPPLNTLDPDDLVARKEQLVSLLGRQLRRLGLSPDYPWNVMMAARAAGLADDERIAMLETLLEIESIKYTLAAHMVRELQAEMP
jgi:hypothetical protein